MIDVQLLGDRHNRLPPRLVLVLMLHHPSHRTLTHLGRVVPPRSVPFMTRFAQDLELLPIMEASPTMPLHCFLH